MIITRSLGCSHDNNVPDGVASNVECRRFLSVSIYLLSTLPIHRPFAMEIVSLYTLMRYTLEPHKRTPPHTHTHPQVGGDGGRVI